MTWRACATRIESRCDIEFSDQDLDAPRVDRRRKPGPAIEELQDVGISERENWPRSLRPDLRDRDQLERVSSDLVALTTLEVPLVREDLNQY
jgi:hypothetical protein